MANGPPAGGWPIGTFKPYDGYCAPHVLPPPGRVKERIAREALEQVFPGRSWGDAAQEGSELQTREVGDRCLLLLIHQQQQAASAPPRRLVESRRRRGRRDPAVLER